MYVSKTFGSDRHPSSILEHPNDRDNAAFFVHLLILLPSDYAGPVELTRCERHYRKHYEKKIILKKIFENTIQAVLCIHNATNEAAAVATSIFESKQREQQCIERRIVEVSELAKNFTACSVIVSFKSRHMAGCFPPGDGGLILVRGATRP